MKLHDNDSLTISAIVQAPREGQTNPRAISEKFAVCSAEVASSKGKAWVDIVAVNGLSSKLASLQAGQAFNATGRLDSNRGSDGRWRVRFFADIIEVESDQLAISTEESAA